MDKLCRGPYRISSILKWVTEKLKQRGWLKKRIMTAFEWKTFFVWRVTYICVHVTQAQILPTSSKHVSLGMHFLGLGIGGLSHQSCMSLHIGTNNTVGGSMNAILKFPVQMLKCPKWRFAIAAFVSLSLITRPLCFPIYVWTMFVDVVCVST